MAGLGAWRRRCSLWLVRTWASALHGSPIHRVFETLLLNLVEAFPDDVAGARVNELEGVEDVIAHALRGARGEAGELAGEEEIRALEFDDVRVAAALFTGER